MTSRRLIGGAYVVAAVAAGLGVAVMLAGGAFVLPLLFAGALVATAAGVTGLVLAEGPGDALRGFVMVLLSLPLWGIAWMVWVARGVH